MKEITPKLPNSAATFEYFLWMLGLKKWLMELEVMLDEEDEEENDDDEKFDFSADPNREIGPFENDDDDDDEVDDEVKLDFEGVNP